MDQWFEYYYSLAGNLFLYFDVKDKEKIALKFGRYRKGKSLEDLKEVFNEEEVEGTKRKKSLEERRVIFERRISLYAIRLLDVIEIDTTEKLWPYQLRLTRFNPD